MSKFDMAKVEADMKKCDILSQFSVTELKLIADALLLKKSSLERAVRAESNPEIRTIRSNEADICAALVTRFR